ncbi:glycosyltransferase [Pleurocapsa sp. PCC 7327]|uniref:glycosyltransferase family 4 protein n=1 Tax=Pleurocapsa sp. PCC 7327 TaxID=118163 RepID=UPI00029FD4E5|nr:glycosyltransferase family 4 protein [Pleurocapsa sp. PCC 7327]AFY79108.1 glycosyltransferase [Pleurocapsa sp. PCC 7327]
MRIAQVAPLWERVPPQGYGGIELVVGHLTDELVNRGYEVTLFASGDSETLAELKATVPRALRLDPSIKEPAAYELLQLTQVTDMANEFDLIHFHTGITPLPFVPMLKTSVVHTLHGCFTSDNHKIFDRYRDQPYISISNAQRRGAPQLNYLSTVYNGIRIEDYPFQEQPENPPYLAFLGRMSPEKGPQHAIAIARAAGIPLKMGGKVDKVDRDFFEAEIVPHIDSKNIEYLGELDLSEKWQLFANASVTLFPITWSEPFGLVTIESMCTGTPVVAMNLGSVPEVIAHQETGWVCSSLEEMIAAVPKAMELDRRKCREYVEQRFSIIKMVDDYEAAYKRAIQEKLSLNGKISNSVLTNGVIS